MARIFRRDDSGGDDDAREVNPKGEPHSPQADQHKGKYTEPKSTRHTDSKPKGRHD